jgi:hypothetical protein
VAPASAIHTPVTDAGAPQDELQALSALGIEVVVLDAGAEDRSAPVMRPTARQGEP